MKRRIDAALAEYEQAIGEYRKFLIELWHKGELSASDVEAHLGRAHHAVDEATASAIVDAELLP